ncbi:MAG: HAMP domain-containing protein, partial [Bacteroidales bacterium]|nr:HAMP domain-containing protein [Bacteroidales bacterium]
AFSVMSVWFMQRSYRNENLKILRNESLSVLGEMENRYWTVSADEFYQDAEADSLQAAFRDNVDELADLFRTGIYFYSMQGVLLFEQANDFVPEYLDSLMLRDVIEERQQLTFHSIGNGRGLRARVAVFPLRNTLNETLGYFYMPYFSRQDLWRSEMNRFLGFYLAVMVLLSVVMMTVSHWLARRISRPLSLVAEKVSRISLTQKNEHLVWNRKDEIGKLVEQYNVLVDELETSSRKLAESERESAWSEMARQVAHEIKNPLTPLKLQAQQLQRAYRDGKPDFDVRLDKFTALLCEQIDRLAAIAGAFSQFSKWQKPALQAVFPVDILKKTEAFYAADEHTVFELLLPPMAEKICIEADPRFVEQILHNLIKNALQALQEAGTENPRIVLELREMEESCIIIV